MSKELKINVDAARPLKGAPAFLTDSNRSVPEKDFVFLGKRHEKDYFNGFVWFGPKTKPKYTYKK